MSTDLVCSPGDSRDYGGSICSNSNERSQRKTFSTDACIHNYFCIISLLFMVSIMQSMPAKLRNTIWSFYESLCFPIEASHCSDIKDCSYHTSVFSVKMVRNLVCVSEMVRNLVCISESSISNLHLCQWTQGILHGPYPHASICRTESSALGKSFSTVLTEDNLMANIRASWHYWRVSEALWGNSLLVKFCLSLKYIPITIQEPAVSVLSFCSCCREKQTTRYPNYFLMEYIENCHWLKNRIMELWLISAELRSQSPD